MGGRGQPRVSPPGWTGGEVVRVVRGSAGVGDGGQCWGG